MTKTQTIQTATAHVSAALSDTVWMVAVLYAAGNAIVALSDGQVIVLEDASASNAAALGTLGDVEVNWAKY